MRTLAGALAVVIASVALMTNASAQSTTPSRPPDRCSYGSSNRDWPPPRQTRACIRERGTGKKVLLIGDSHAEAWAPGLVKIAKNHNWRFRSLTRAKCTPWNFNQARPDDGAPPTLGHICQHWKKVAYPTVIKRFDPDLVLIAGRPQIYGIRLDGRVIPRSSKRWMPRWKDSWTWLVRTTAAEGAKIGAITLAPTMPVDVPECLQQYGAGTHRCDMRLADDPDTAIPNRFIRGIHRVYDRVWSVLGTSLICPRHLCKAMQDGLITHADQSHITIGFSRSIAHHLYGLLSARHLLRD